MGKKIIVESNDHLRNIIEDILLEEHGITRDQINEQWFKDLIKRLSRVFSGEKAVVKQSTNFSRRAKNFKNFYNTEMHGLYFAREGKGLPSAVKVGPGFNRFAANYTDDLVSIMDSVKESSATSPVWLKPRLRVVEQDIRDLIRYMNESRSGTVNLNMVVGKSLAVREQLALTREEIGENLKNINKNDLQSFFNMFTNEEKIMGNFQSELETLVLKAKKSKPAVPK
jgi:hypothetical protein